MRRELEAREASGPTGRAARLAKRAVALAAYHGGAVSLVRRVRCATGRPATPILVYHRIVEETDALAAVRCRSGMAVTAANFDAQMRHLARHYQVMSLSQVVARLRAGAPLPPRACAITFDDGYADNYQLAYPILKRLGLPATFFLTTGFVGTPEAPWTARLEQLLVSPEGEAPSPQLLCELKALPVAEAEAQVGAWEGAARRCSVLGARCSAGKVAKRLAVRSSIGPGTGHRAPGTASEASMMSWEQVRRMRADGFEFGGHTRRHALLTVEEPVRAREEIEGSYADLLTHLGPGEYGFAYPNGSQDAVVRAWVRAAGYQYACGMKEDLCGARADLFDLPRRDVNSVKTTWPNGRFCAAMFEATIQDLWGALRVRSE